MTPCPASPPPGFIACSIPGCGKRHLARGWCSAHYSRFRRHGDPTGGCTPQGKPMEFLLAAIGRETDGCILWPYGSNNGYGRVYLNGIQYPAPRLVLMLTEGDPPSPRHYAAHEPVACHNSLCINKRHLRWATPAENEADKILDGTSNRGEKCGAAKLRVSDVLAIRDAVGVQERIATQFGVSQATVSEIKSRKKWAHVA